MKSKAFTLIETILAVTLMTIILTAVFGLILMTMTANQRNLHQIQATFYAQEGLEAVRYMRDSNWLQNYTWDGGATLWGADFHVDESTPMVTRTVIQKSCTGSDPCYQLSASDSEEDRTLTTSNGFVFQRSLEFKAVDSSTLKSDIEADSASSGDFLDGAVEVTAIVTWEDSGVERSVKLSTYLTAWQ